MLNQYSTPLPGDEERPKFSIFTDPDGMPRLTLAQPTQAAPAERPRLSVQTGPDGSQKLGLAPSAPPAQSAPADSSAQPATAAPAAPAPASPPQEQGDRDTLRTYLMSKMPADLYSMPKGLDLAGLQAAQQQDLGREGDLRFARAGERALSMLQNRAPNFQQFDNDHRFVNQYLQQRQLAQEEQQRRLAQLMQPMTMAEKLAALQKTQGEVGKVGAETDKLRGEVGMQPVERALKLGELGMQPAKQAGLEAETKLKGSEAWKASVETANQAELQNGRSLRSRQLVEAAKNLPGASGKVADGMAGADVLKIFPQLAEIGKFRAERPSEVAPGFHYTGPGVYDPAEAKDFREQVASTAHLQSLLRQYKSAHEALGQVDLGRLTGPSAARLANLHGQLVAEVRTLIGARTLTDSDIKLADMIAPAAAGTAGIGSRKSTITAAIDQLSKNATEGLYTKGKARFFEPAADAATKVAAQLRASGMTDPNQIADELQRRGF